MPPFKSWLEQLTLLKLHRLAVLIGTQCSGSKAARIEGIQRATRSEFLPYLTDVTGSGRNGLQSSAKFEPKELGLLSIDMGIRNLAFAHFRTTSQKIDDGVIHFRTPHLLAWERISVTEDIGNAGAVLKSPQDVAKKPVKAKSKQNVDTATKQKESFEPIDYANHAYNLGRHLLDTYKPTHILIERQRFRTGGHSAVQEWTIRVGVFEGMLYAVLRTLAEERKIAISVEPMLPARVNRFWLEEMPPPPLAQGRRKSQDVKKMKINLVGSLLDGSKEIKQTKGFEAAEGVKGDFMAEWKREKRRSGSLVTGREKLDDLADCLLQGLAWIEWQGNRKRVQVLGKNCFDLDGN